MKVPLFEVANATFSYGHQPALRNMSLSIFPGERIALLGANGSGKSTLLRLLDGLYFVEQGQILFQGHPLTEAKFGSDEFAYSFRRKVGLVFQNPDIQLFNPTVMDEVAFGPLQLRLPKAEVRDRVNAILEQLNITVLKDRPPHQLSGGEKKKVALASVLVMEPEVLLLDEPTAALDPRSQTQILRILSDWSGLGRTIITATHDLHFLEDMAGQCHIFDHGQLAASGTPREVLTNPDLLRQANLIHAHRHSGAGGHIHA